MVLLTAAGFAVLGYAFIMDLGGSQAAGLHFTSEALAPIQETLRGMIVDRYSQTALGWVGSVFGLAWLFAGKQAKQAERLLNRI